MTAKEINDGDNGRRHHHRINNARIVQRCIAPRGWLRIMKRSVNTLAARASAAMTYAAADAFTALA